MNNKIIIINGPNLNLLGEREQSQYGTKNFEELKNECKKKGDELGIKIDIVQSNIEGEIVDILFDTENETPLSCDLPSSVILKIKYTEPGERGNTATNATKSAILETNAEVNVPLFINEGDEVKIDTIKGHYIERIKS